MPRLLIILALLLPPFVSAFSQSVKKVRGEYTYYAPENVTLEEAKRTALSMAQIQALADEFGTVVAQHNVITTQETNGQGNTDFASLSSTDVKGEWIETIGQPEYDISYAQGTLVVKCSVSGKAREIVARSTEFVARVLRNGTDDRAESDRFKSGDDLYLSYQSAAEGYLAVYLVDAANNAYCLLPYRSSKDGKVKVDANRHYVFFSEKNAAPLCAPSDVDEYTLTCEQATETNFIYIVSSPNPFVKAIDSVTNEGLPRELPFADFEKWLAKNRTRDKDMQVDIKTISVSQ